MLTGSFYVQLVLLVLGLSALAACNDPNPQLPLYEEEIYLLTDIMLIEGLIQDFSGRQKDSLAVVNYNLLYDRHGISETDLQELRRRYSKDPTLWVRATDSINARLKRGRSDFDTLLNPELN